MEVKRMNRYRAIPPLYGGGLAIGVYLAAGHYRTLLVIAGYYFAESLLLYIRTGTSYIKPVFGPLVAVAVIVDVMKEEGSALGIFTALLLFVVLELVSNKYLVALVGRLTHQGLFGRCPSCSYANKQLTERCKHCGYKGESGLLQPLPAITDHEGFHEKCTEGLSPLPQKCRSLLNFENNERCIGGVRIFPERGVYVDGCKVLVKYLVITSSRVILLDYHFYYSGWTYRQDIGINGAATSIVVRKHHQKKQVPILVLQTAEASYELFYSAHESARKKLEAIQSCIEALAGDH